MWLLAFLPIPLLFAFVLSGRLSTGKAAAVVLATAVVVATIGYRTGPWVVATALGKGLWLGLWILCVVWPALLLYRIAYIAGLERIGRVFVSVLPRRRESLLLLAWLFPSFLQGVAGFGTPIAIAAPLLVAMGWSKTRAVLYPLVGYHWSVTFGSMGSSFYMASLTAHLGSQAQSDFALRAGLLLAVNSLLAGALVLILDGGLRALREGSRMLGLVGVPMAVTLVATASVAPAVATLAAGTVGFLATFALSAGSRRSRALVAVPMGSSDELSPPPPRHDAPAASSVHVLAPYLYLLLTALPVLVIPASRAWVSRHIVLALDFPETVTRYDWVNPAVSAYTPIAVLAHPGFYVLLATILGYLTYRLAGLWPSGQRGAVLKPWLQSLPRGSISILLLASVATVMADAGMVAVLARGVAAVTGSVFPALAPLIGGLGSFMTGSTTVSNALFAGFQRDVAGLLDVAPSILLAAQTAGGNVGNALAPVVVLIGLTAVDEPDLLSAVLRGCLWPAALLFAVLSVLTTVSLMLG